MAKLCGVPGCLQLCQPDEKDELARTSRRGRNIIDYLALANDGSCVGEVFQADRLSAAHSVIERKWEKRSTSVRRD